MQRKKITAIAPQAKYKNRRSIFLDGEFAFGVDAEILLRHNLGLGDELSQPEIDALIEEDHRKAAKDKALRLLGVRARSTNEIRTRLKQSGFAEAVIDWVVDELQRLRLLNDRDFAQMYARSRMITHPVGSLLLRQELSAKGLAVDDLEAGVAAAYQEIDEYELARRLALQKKQRSGPTDELVAKKRIANFLLRRGFSWEIVNKIIDHWKDL